MCKRFELLFKKKKSILNSTLFAIKPGVATIQMSDEMGPEMIMKNMKWVRAFRMQAGYCVSFDLCSIDVHLKRYD